MTKPIYLAALALAALPLSTSLAQTTKGTRILGLSVGELQYTKDDSYSRFGAQLLPSAGKFVSDKVALGVSLPLGYTRSKSTYQGGESKYHSLDVGVVPWLRYYVPSESRHRIFGEAGVGAALNNYKSSNSYGARNTVYLLGNLGAGYTYFLTPDVGLEALVAYNVHSGDSDTFGSTNLGAKIGFRIYLPKNTSSAAPTQ